VCLLVVAWQAHPRYPLIVAGNRDEFHARPAATADWWADSPALLGGRDLQAGGTWLAVNRNGRFGVVTNFREPAADTAGQRSRGELVVDFLTSPAPPRRWLTDLAARSAEYGGYNLLLAGDGELHYSTNRGDDAPGLAPGIYGLSNHRLDTPWPKVRRIKDRLAALLENEDLASAPLFRILADRTPAPDDALPATGVPLAWERMLSAAFIVSPQYGTRVSTVVRMTAQGCVEFGERRFDANGERVGQQQFEFRPGD
jgi:uncharacterized protein with NRDE domain